MKKKTSLAALPALVVLLFACSKNNSGNVNGTYQSNGTMSVTPARMYVAGGAVITDTSVTGPYARRFNMPSVHPGLGFLIGASSATMPFTYKLTIDDLQGTIYFENEPPAAVDIRHTPDLLLLARRDSSTYFYPNPDDRCAQLLRHVLLDHSDSTCYTMPLPTFTDRYCKYRDVFPLSAAGPALNLPTMVLAISGNGCSRNLFNAWGRFNTALAAELQAGDTILVQERTLPLYEQ